MKIYYKTYGCTLNQSDADLTQSALEAQGHVTVESEAQADAVVVSTCGVKETTENKILYYLNRLDNEGKRVVVSGCLPAMGLERVKAAAPHALGFVGPNGIGKIPALLENAAKMDSDTATSDLPREFMHGKFSEKAVLENSRKGTIARIQVSSGCLSACTFCATKLARGTFESKSVEAIVKETQRALALGAKEIQLCSQDIACYGFDRNTNIARAVAAVNQLEGRFRVRIGMGSPQHFLKFEGELVEALKMPKTYKFLHVPLQSGNDTVLKDMRRMYAIESAERLLERISRNVPGVLLATDMIVGFPGETEEQFEDSMALLKRVRFDMVNVSKYSARPGTVAAKMKPVPTQVKKSRAAAMSALSLAIAAEKNAELAGCRVTALVCENARAGQWMARTDNYKPVLLQKRPASALGSFVQVEIERTGHSFLMEKNTLENPSPESSTDD